MATPFKNSYRCVPFLQQFYEGGAFVVSSDASFIACACGDSIKIVHSDTAAIRSTVEGGESEVFTALALSPNDKLLFSGGHSRQIRVLDLSTLKCVRSWKGHDGPVMGMACHLSGGLLATAGADRKVLVWDVDGGFCRQYSTGHKGVVSSILFHPDPNKQLYHLYGYCLQIAPRQIIRRFSSQSYRQCTTPLINLTKILNNRLDEEIEQKFSENRQVILTNDLVYTTLLKCSSDLVALSFFMWCAKQPNFFHNPATFDYMVGVVSRLMKRYETVNGILGGLESVGNVTKAQTFLLLLRIYWRGGMYNLVFEAFDHMDHCGFTPNTFARNVIMDVLFKVGRADVALKVFKETLLPNFLTFNIVLCNLSKIKDLMGIGDAFRCMLRMGYCPNPGTFEVVLNGLCKLGRLAEAYQVLGIMTTFGISMSVNIWTIMIDGFCRLHRIDEASSLVKKMKKSGCSPNIVTYTTLIKGYIHAQRVNDAFDVLSIIESEGPSPDLILYNVLIDSLAKNDRYNDALRIFLSLDKRNVLPDCYTFSSLLNTICLSKRLYLLPKLVDGFFVEVDLVACNSLLSYLGKAGFAALALKLYNDMVNKGLMPDKYSVLGVLTGLCESRRISEAVCLYNDILLNYTGVDAHIHTVIIDGLIKAGKFHSAIRIFRTNLLEENSLDVVAYSVVIRGLLMVGRNTEASNLYNYMKGVGINPNGHICNVMLSTFCKEKNFALVKQVLQEMIDLGIAMSRNNFFGLYNAICRSSNDSHLVIYLLIKMEILGLLPRKRDCKTLVHNPLKGVNISEKHYKLLNGCLECCRSGDTSSSEEYTDVAAFVG